MTQLQREDLWSLEEYAVRRSEYRAEVMAHKKPANSPWAGTRVFILRTPPPSVTRYRKCCVLKKPLRQRA